MNYESQGRCPRVGDVPGEYQMAFSAYIQSRREGWLSAEEWLKTRVPVAERVTPLGKGTTRTEGTNTPISQPREPQPLAKPISTVDLGHRPLSDVGFPRHGEPLNDTEIIDGHGDVFSRATTVREDY